MYEPVMRHLLMPAAVWASLFSFAAADPESRTLDVTLLRPDGKPAPGIVIDLIGTDRSNLHNAFDPDNENKPEPASSPWRVKTDAGGKARFQLACVSQYDNDQAPGWGPYHLIAQDGEKSTAVSPRIVHMQPDAVPYYLESYRKEWNANPLVLKDVITPLTLRLKPGIELKGRLLDAKGNPTQGSIQIWQNLGAGTHTGYGADILKKGTVTDAKGNFTIKGIYPNTFIIAPADDHDRYWVKTSVRGKSSDLPLDEITPLPDEKEISITCTFATNAPYLYQGAISDPDGHPISGATVTLAPSMHKREKMNWGDDHHFTPVVSDEKGRYSFRHTTPFIRFIRAEAEGYEAQTEENENDAFLRPGTHSFKLQPEAKAE
ncbi:hypothetical protein llg_33620 [Luteolibacter sp. LG18]|nr:hypothetical protein llg_33620 [Luteolibacter sp. LG18]